MKYDIRSTIYEVRYTKNDIRRMIYEVQSTIYNIRYMKYEVGSCPSPLDKLPLTFLLKTQ
jgi:hypothetical protein